MADLHEPALAAYGQFDLGIDDEWHPIEQWDIVDRTDMRNRIVFEIPYQLAHRARIARKIGARVVAPSGDVFFGFQMTNRDGLVSEMIRGCPVDQSRQSLMVELPDTDFPGHDLTTNGFRGVSFSHCKQICLEYAQCQAVSYVQAKSWCWPKGRAARQVSAPGLISAYRQ